MRKFIVVLFVLMMVSVGMSSAIFWDIQKLFTGRQMIYYGAPWIGDDTNMYFGDDKDVSIKYNTTSGQGEVVGLAAVSNLSIAMESGEDITFAGGDSKFDIDAGTGITSTTSGVNYLNGNVQTPSSKTVKFGGATNAASFKSNTTIYAVTTLNSGGAATLNSGIINTTLAVAGLTSANGGLAVGVNASTVLSTTLTSSSTKTVYDVDASGANRTLTLPDAATVDGRMYFISVAGNPGNNYVRITATGGDDINANNYLVSTDQWSTAIVVASNGAYRALTSGTWAAHA